LLSFCVHIGATAACRTRSSPVAPFTLTPTEEAIPRLMEVARHYPPLRFGPCVPPNLYVSQSVSSVMWIDSIVSPFLFFCEKFHQSIYNHQPQYKEPYK
jgi:hypothetical protein